VAIEGLFEVGSDRFAGEGEEKGGPTQNRCEVGQGVIIGIKLGLA
jgi:hypothetical protein